MRIPGFGRKASPRDENPGHAAVLRRLKIEDATDPNTRLRLAGRVVSDLVLKIVANERGVRVEDYLAILASVGGFSCIVGALQTVAEARQDRTQGDLVTLQGKDGCSYFFGDLPNAALWESHLSLLSLAMGASQEYGAAVSAQMVEDVMRHVAGTVGGPEFGIPRLPPEHMPGDRPLEYVRHLWPKLREAMDLYEVPFARRATAFGFAVQHALDLGKDALNPTLATRVVVECAVPMAKVDPIRLF